MLRLIVDNKREERRYRIRRPASDENPTGAVELGFAVDNLGDLYARRDQLGLEFTRPPHEQHGTHLAQFRDCEGANVSVSGPA